VSQLQSMGERPGADDGRRAGGAAPRDPVSLDRCNQPSPALPAGGGLPPAGAISSRLSKQPGRFLHPPSFMSTPPALGPFGFTWSSPLRLPGRGRRAKDSPASLPPLIAFCHLSWHGVWQRPQQFLSRLAQTRALLFVETYCSDVPSARIHQESPAGHPNVVVLAMHLPAARWADGAFIDGERRRLLQEYQARDPRFARPVLWFNDPMAVTAFAGHANELAIVYDCMDELAQFQGAPPQLVGRERELLRRADVVFCGGRKMRDKRLPENPHCHFYGTGVDLEHFGRALRADLAVDPAIAGLPGPVLGYFGVIDERIDYDLLAQLADDLPRASIAMVGPTAKVDPAIFPMRPNLHWLGRREYADLPAITKGFTVCLMPFARNAATEYINPTKALEYMAAGRPIVSTALDEVRTNFGPICRIAENAAAFVRACDEECRTPSSARIRRGLALARANTWESITAQMSEHIAEAVSRRTAAPRESVRAALIPGVLRHV